MYRIEIKTKKGIVVIYLENILKLEKELLKYPNHDEVKVKNLKKNVI